MFTKYVNIFELCICSCCFFCVNKRFLLEDTASITNFQTIPYVVVPDIFISACRASLLKLCIVVNLCFQRDSKIFEHVIDNY